jgi:hypothetical protein
MTIQRHNQAKRSDSFSVTDYKAARVGGVINRRSNDRRDRGMDTSGEFLT